jgi:hypothetical protein
MRQIEFLETELADVDRLVALDALGWTQAKRLMSVPGVNVICAASFLAAVGDISRFKDPRKLVGYLGLDPKVRQSGPGPGTSGHISKQGSASARWALVEASWSAVRQPGPLRAFYQRVRARRGHQIAIVAAARKLACLFWFLLTRGEDYAYAATLTDQEETAPPGDRGRRPEIPGPLQHLVNQRRDARSRTRARRTSRTRLQKHRPRLASSTGQETDGGGGRECDKGARIQQALEGQSRAADHKPLTSALRYVSHSRPAKRSHHTTS